jgi:2-C-methyl-D-erythritol 4-phosphate cytidylyltransferase/2-C-methyl-D-erythritol 2,4-cyclodiphosphate synthase
MFVSAIIAAGGRGERLGGSEPKPLRTIAGRTLLERSIEPFDASDRIDEIVLVLSAELMETPLEVLQSVGTPLRMVPGGERRQDSVAAGLGVIAARSDIVVVHDAARPFCTTELIGRTIDAAFESGAAISALPAVDTVKEGQLEDGVAVVRSTLAREQIYLAQTPQAFRVGVLRDAVARGRDSDEATDEASLAERAGYPVRLISGDPNNIKITSEADLSLARRIAGDIGPSGLMQRVGIGYDVHRLVEGRRLVLGGVHIPGPRGLLGHSDADAVCHAITDAIGRHFPDDDPQWKDASSTELLRQAVTLIHGLGFAVNNVDVVVVAEWPKIQSVAGEMQQRLAEVLLVASDRVSVKGKTGEGVGAVGRGEAVVVHAIASLEGRPDPSPGRP